MSDDVKRLPVRKKPPVEDRMLVVASYWDHKKCRHGNYIVDGALAEVECGKCHAMVNPMHVLVELCNKEAQYHQTRERYNDEMKRLAERSRTKCRHCGKLTEISRG